MRPCTIYGRDLELAQLRALLACRNSFLLFGAAGVGKTLLVSRLLAEVDDALYCEEATGGLFVFREILAQLLFKENAYAIRACRARGSNVLARKSAVAVRGIVARALRESNYWLVLDHVKSPSQAFAAAIHEICSTNTSLLVVARSAHMEDVGFLLPMFCERSARYELRNFDSSTARQFAEGVARELQLQAANQEDVIEKVLRYSKGNPGAIRAMLEMALNPRYVAQQHIKFSPLYIDFRLKWGGGHG
ncbi:MAG TPA: ATP-binding protein [Terriglobales bacterium]|nr:ATP-binding protein [Terriglobales bacterium]